MESGRVTIHHQRHIVVPIALHQAIQERPVLPQLRTDHPAIKTSLGMIVKLRPRGVDIDRVGNRHSGQQQKAQVAQRQLGQPSVHEFRQHQSIGPVDVLPAHGEREVVLDVFVFVGRKIAGQIEAIPGLLDGRPGDVIAFAIEALVVVEIAIGGAGLEIKLMHVIDVQPRISHQVVLPQDVRILLDIVDGEKAEGEIAAVIQQCPLIGRDLGIDVQPLVALDLLKLPLKTLDAGLRLRQLPRHDQGNESRRPKQVSHPIPLLQISFESATAIGRLGGYSIAQKASCKEQGVPTTAQSHASNSRPGSIPSPRP